MLMTSTGAALLTPAAVAAVADEEAPVACVPELPGERL
jgi:hypothetical protein